MIDESTKPRSSIFFIGLIFVCIFFIEFVHYDLSRISSDHPHQIVLIYELPKDTSERWPSEAPVVDTIASIDRVELEEDTSQVWIQMDTAQAGEPLLVAEIEPEEKVTKVGSQESKKRDLPIIRYYVKQKDEGRVYKLRSLGYYIHERESSGLKEFSSNAIFYGDQVSSRDIFVVANFLLGQGFEIKAIEKSRYHAGWKSKAIEIGTDTTRLKDPSISKKELLERWGDQ